MTETDVLSVLSDFADNCGTYLAMYISVTFAYLTVAYFVGGALSRFQCAVISFLYIVFALVTGATTIGWANAWLILKESQKTLVDQVWLFHTPALFPGLVALLVGVAVLSLYFMYDVRRAKREDAT